MEEEVAASSQSFSAKSDICQQLLARYSNSSAEQHRHLCATAAAARSIIESSSLPLTPLSYFAATITSLSSSEALDSTALAALTSFLSIVLPLVGGGGITQGKSEDAVKILIGLVEESGDKLGTSSVRAVLKCLCVLVVESCKLSNWDSISLGFEDLLKFCMDKRPKVRKCAQDSILKIFKSFDSSAVCKKASKLIYVLLKEHMRLVLKFAAGRTVDDSTPIPELLDVLHLLTVIKPVVPYLDVKARARTLLQLLKLLGSHFSELTMHIFYVISAIFETSETGVIVANAESIFKSLVPYISLEEKNTVETALAAASLAKTALDILHDNDANRSTAYLTVVAESMAGLLSFKANVSLQASNLFRALIERHLDNKRFSAVKIQELDDESIHIVELKSAKSICRAFYNALSTSHHIPDAHFLSVIALLFLKLDKVSCVLMADILLKLSDLMNATSAGVSEIKHLQDCIGSAVVVMGPEKVLQLLPISVNAKEFSCSNSWLLPILRKNIVGSSLQYFMEHIVPLAFSLEQASQEVIKSVIGRELQAFAHDCWQLLPAFCRQPSDTYQSFGALTKLLIPYLKKDSFMLESIAVCLKELVNQNKSVLTSDQGSLETTQVQSTGIINDFVMGLETRTSYTRKIAKKNVKALASCSTELLQVLISLLFESSPETRKHLKGAIGSLASISDPSTMKQIFLAYLKTFQLPGSICDNVKVEHDTGGPANEVISTISVRTDAECLILDLTSCFVDVSDKDLVNLLFGVIKHSLQATDSGQIGAYQTLGKILEKHSWFCSSQFAMVMDLLSEVKLSKNIMLLQSRFACMQILLFHIIMKNLDEENTKAFLILNEIIVTLKDSNEERRKVAYEAISGISCKLKQSSSSACDGPYHKLLGMVIGYLSGSSPHIKSGVVSALSVLVYNDPDIFLKVPDMLSPVLELLHCKAIDVIKAVLGFLKVFASCLEPEDLQKFLPDIVDGILRWSSVSRFHFKEKVTVILEILMRKCSVAKVKMLAPEKYKDFMQGVITNRRGKASSKKHENKEAKPELADPSPRRNEKRKREQMPISTKNEGSKRPWKRNGDKKQSSAKSFERVGHSGPPKGKPNSHQGGRKMTGSKTNSYSRKSRRKS